MPIITAAYMLLSQNATPAELQAAQAPTTFYVSIAGILLAGLQDVIKGWKLDLKTANIKQQETDIKQQAADNLLPPPTPTKTPEFKPQPVEPEILPTDSDFDIYHKYAAFAQSEGKQLLDLDTIRDASGKIIKIVPHYSGENVAKVSLQTINR